MVNVVGLFAIGYPLNRDQTRRLPLIAASFITTSNPKPLANPDRKDDAIAKDHDKNLDKGGPKGNDAPPKDKVGNPPPIVAQAMPLDANGHASFNAHANKGAVSYRVFLQKGRAYNFFAQSADFEPHVKIAFDDRVLEAKQGTKSCFVSVTPDQSAAHTVTISARLKESGSFSCQFAPAESRPLVKLTMRATSTGTLAGMGGGSSTCWRSNFSEALPPPKGTRPASKK